jgi:hypothetical protein
MQQQLKDAYPGLLGTLLTTVGLTVGRSPEQGAYSALYDLSSLFLSPSRMLTWLSRYAATSPEIEQKGWNGVYLTDPVSDTGMLRAISYLIFYSRENWGKRAREPVIQN